MMKIICQISLTVTLVTLLSVTGFGELKKITLVYSSSTNGNIDYCHCKEDPNGGLVKRATQIMNIKKRNIRTFLFDTGDIFLPEPDRILTQYLIKSYEYMKYDAVAVGDQEFSLGIKYLMDIRKRLPFVNNNLTVKIKGRIFMPFDSSKIIDRGGVKVGVIGTTTKNTFQFYPKSIIRNIAVKSQMVIIRRNIKYLKRKNPNVIVLLSHEGLHRNRKIAKKIKDIHVIIGGHSQRLIKSPVFNGKTLIVQSGANGAHIGVLDLYMAKNKIIKYKNRFYLPDDKSPQDDRYIRSLINEYKRESKNKYKKLKFN